MRELTKRGTGAVFALAVLASLAACEDGVGAPSGQGRTGQGRGVDLSAITADTVCSAVPAGTVASVTGRDVSPGKGTIGACEWKAPQAVRVRLFPPGEWTPRTDYEGYRELSGIGAQAYVAKGTFGNGYSAEALLGDRAVAAIIPADWATEDMAVSLLRAAVERLG